MPEHTFAWRQQEHRTSQSFSHQQRSWLSSVMKLSKNGQKVRGSQIYSIISIFHHDSQYPTPWWDQKQQKMRINCVTSTCCPKSVVTLFSATSISHKCTDIWATWHRFDWLLDIFLVTAHAAETAISQLLVTTLITPLESATSISFKSRKLRRSESIYGRSIAIFLCACAETPTFPLPVQNLPSPSFLVRLIFYN